MILAALLFAVGIGLSAFFSGTETGLYRVPRVRLVLDALSGRLLARGLIWLLNRPAMFVATSLVGNNIANYMVSFSVVLAVEHLFAGQATTAELIAPIMMTPVVFVLGELLPKYLFFNAPYRLLGLAGGPFLLTTLLLAPVSMLLGLMGQLLSLLTGETPFRVQLAFARTELQRVFREGHEAGLLGTRQRTFAQNVWEVGTRPAFAYAVPPDRLPMISDPSRLERARLEARRQGHYLILVRRGRTIQSYIRYAELRLRGSDGQVQLHDVVHVPMESDHLDVLMQLVQHDSEVAALDDPQGKVRAVVTRRQLLEPLLSDQPR